MPGVTAALDKLASVRALAFDLDGTIYLDGSPLPGALELLSGLEAAGVDYLLVTNNSSETGAAYARKLGALGLGEGRERLLTSNDVARSHLLAAGLRRPYLLATDEVRDEYAASGIEHQEDAPDSVLLTFDTSLTFDKLAAATRHIAQGLPYLASHPDATCPVPGGFLPDTGSFIELLFAATGRRPQVLGKPHGGMIREIGERLGLSGERIGFVGDRLTTDIQMARDAGFVGILTLTGVTGRQAIAESAAKPDVVVSGMGELHSLLLRGILRART